MPTEYIYGLLGGVLIGAAGSGMLVTIGRIMGVSGIVGGLMNPKRGETAWRLLFLAGILCGGLLMLWLKMPVFSYGISRSSLVIAVGGLLVGFGTLLGSGCTSGHGVCGISRLSMRSLLATITFILSGALTVLAIRVFSDGGL